MTAKRTHDDMYGEVKGDRDPRCASLAVELHVAERSSRAVVENVKEC